MDKQNYHEDPPSAQNPPLYSEKQPYDQQAFPAAESANSSMPMQYQPYNVPYGAVPSHQGIIQPPEHTTLVVPVQPTHEPDYLVFSIFTLIFCCPPLGLAALVFSIKTRDANHTGNGTEAQRYSRMARILATCAIVVAIVFVTAYIAWLVIVTSKAH